LSGTHQVAGQVTCIFTPKGMEEKNMKRAVLIFLLLPLCLAVIMGCLSISKTFDYDKNADWTVGDWLRIVNLEEDGVFFSDAKQIGVGIVIKNTSSIAKTYTIHWWVYNPNGTLATQNPIWRGFDVKPGQTITRLVDLSVLFPKQSEFLPNQYKLYVEIYEGSMFRRNLRSVYKIEDWPVSILGRGFNVVALDNVELGGIYLSNEDGKGMKYHVANNAKTDMTLTINYDLRKDGEVVESGRDVKQLAPRTVLKDGAILNETSSLSPGRYTMNISFDDGAGGRNVSIERPITILSELPKRSAAYQSKYGWAHHLYRLTPDEAYRSLDVFYKAGMAWLRDCLTPEEKDDNRFDAFSLQKKMLEYDIKGMDLGKDGLRPQDILKIPGARDRYITQMGKDVAMPINPAPEPVMEMWNEPNLEYFFEGTPAQFTALLKETYNSIKKSNPLAFMYGVGTSMTGDAFYKPMFDLGAANYMDGISWHPYWYPTRPEEGILPSSNTLKNLTEQYGGWLMQNITEVGYPTNYNAGHGVTFEQQAKFLVRSQLLGDTVDLITGMTLYDLRNDMYDPHFEYNEAHFGSINMDFTPKDAYIALSAMCRMLMNTGFAGDLAHGSDHFYDEYISVYRRFDGEPVIAAWWAANREANQDEAPTVTIPVGVSSVTVTDLFGAAKTVNTPGGNLTLKLSDGPQYITAAGMSRQLIYTASDNIRADKAKNLRSKIEAVGNAAVRADLLNKFTAANNAISGILRSGSPAQKAAMENQLSALFSLAGDAIRAMNTIGAIQAYNIAEDAYLYATARLPPFMVMSSGTGAARGAQASFDSAKSVIDARKGLDGSLVISERMLERARENLKQRNAAQSEGKTDMADVYGFLSGKLADMARALAPNEPVYQRGIIADMSPGKMTLLPNYSDKIEVSLKNDSRGDIAGKYEIVYPAQWNLKNDVQAFNVPAAEKWSDSMTLSVPGDALSGLYSVKVNAYNGNAVIASFNVNLSVSDPVVISIDPFVSEVGRISEIKGTIQNIGPVPFSGTLEFEYMNGTKLPARLGSSISNLAVSKTSSFNFGFNSSPSDFNDYRIKAIVKDRTGLTVYEYIYPLDFLITTITDKAPSMDSTMNGWENAFPVHIQHPHQCFVYDYDPNVLSATAYTLTDRENLYFAVLVNDKSHNQLLTGGGIWNGDCLQLSIEPRNTKGSDYSRDAFELGFALSGSGTGASKTMASWAVPRNFNDEVVQYEVFRNNENNTTLYKAAIPMKDLPGLEAKAGNKYALNFCINDANIGFAREGFWQFTRGTGDSKSPSYYQSWIFK
jgi:hypothetical protein